MQRLIGVGYRRELAAWIESSPPEIACLEITAEHFYDGPLDRLRHLQARVPLFVHGLGLSLGTPGPLDAQALRQFKAVVEAANPEWISEHIAFTRTGGLDLGHLNPVQPTMESLDVLSRHANELSDHCGKPLLLENITSHLRLDGNLQETEFLNRLCEAAGCALLLDVTNLFINARNHRFDPLVWLKEVDPSKIVQLHLVGYQYQDGTYLDHHASSIQGDLLDLAKEVVKYGSVQAIIVERDHDFPEPAAMAAELKRLECAFGIT